MAITLGKNSQVSLGLGSPVGSLLSFSMSYASALVNTRYAGASSARYLDTGLGDWRLQFEAMFDSADISQDSIRAKLQTGQSHALYVYPEGYGSGRPKWVNSRVFVESCEVPTELDGVVRISVTMRSDGPLVEGVV